MSEVDKQDHGNAAYLRVIPFTIAQKDTKILNIEKSPLHEQKPA